MDRSELIRGFIRDNLGLLTLKSFPVELYKKAKQKYFIERHGNSQQGVPRDSEIASETIWFLIRRNQIQSQDELDKILSVGLMAEKLKNKQTFYEFIESRKPSEPIVDFSKVKQADFLAGMREQIRKELESEMKVSNVYRIEELDKEIQRKVEEYQSIPSVIDGKEFPEPPQPVIELEAQTYIPWWRQLNLTKDPFPVTEGLRRIDPSSYESVIVKTQTFQKYLSYLDEAPEELFKNTIFFGEFGSGKTTLFEYLTKAFSSKEIYSIYVQLYSEKDLQSLKIKFKEKMIEELQEILNEHEGDVLSIGTANMDMTLRTLLNKLESKLNSRGLIIFVDDLHKNKEDYPVSLEFLSYLQIFTSEIVKKTGFQDIAFYVAGALPWEHEIRTQPRYSGSLARRETIPDITEEEAWQMLNKRLEAFYPNPEVKRTVDRKFVAQVYKDLKINKFELTFRGFIRRLVDEFKIGDFHALTSDPVHIQQDVLDHIKKDLESNTILKERFNTLLQEKIQGVEQRVASLRLLADIFLKKSVKDQDLTENKYFCLKQLSDTRLIIKQREKEHDFSWIICPELSERVRFIASNYSLSLEDYILKIYGLTPGKRKGLNEEIQQTKTFIDESVVEGKDILEGALKLHKEIIEIMENYNLEISEIELASKCRQSLELLTRFYLTQVEPIDESSPFTIGLEFWKDYWYSPREMAQFQNVISDEYEIRQRIWHVCSIYRQAYSSIFVFITREYQFLTSVRIPSLHLDNSDIKQLVEARDWWSNQNYERCVQCLYGSIQSKLRTFVQNIFTLIYGDIDDRFNHVAEPLRSRIRDSLPSKPSSLIQEFSTLTLKEIGELMTDANANREINNWNCLFSKLFQPLTKDEITGYINRLSSLKLQCDNMEEFGKDISLELRELLLFMRDLSCKSNMAYVNLLREGLQIRLNVTSAMLYITPINEIEKLKTIGLSFRPEVFQALDTHLSSGTISLSDQSYAREYEEIPVRH
ncbi:MAG: ATP-binding protein [Nitrososphaeria archaeon]